MKKGQYSKWLVPIVILLNVLFAIGIVVAMKFGADEPTTLVNRWFDWTTVEILALFGIKAGKIGKDVLMELFATLKEKYKKKEDN